jgi:hypothetical protein
MGASKLWKLFHREPKFHTLKTDAEYDEEDGIESEELLRKKRSVAQNPSHSTTWIFLTVANVVIMSITIGVVLSGKRSLEKNSVLRPVSWWCKSSCLDLTVSWF